MKMLLVYQLCRDVSKSTALATATVQNYCATTRSCQQYLFEFSTSDSLAFLFSFIAQNTQCVRVTQKEGKNGAYCAITPAFFLHFLSLARIPYYPL